MKLCHSPSIGNFYTYDHEECRITVNHEMAVQEFLLKNLKDDSVFVDVGAYIGLFSLIASTRIKTGKIYSFEPVQSSIEIIKANVKLHNVKNITLLNKAISNVTGEDHLFWREGAQCISRIYIHPRDNNVYHVEVIPTIKLDDFERDVKIDFMKIDIEGSEVELFEGAKEFFKRNKDCIVILELHNLQIEARGIKLNDFIKNLSQDFDCYDLNLNKLNDFPFTGHFVLKPKKLEYI